MPRMVPSSSTEGPHPTVGGASRVPMTPVALNALMPTSPPSSPPSIGSARNRVENVRLAAYNSRNEGWQMC